MNRRLLTKLSFMTCILSSSLQAVISSYAQNDSLQNIENYSKFGIEGTSGLAFRDVFYLIKKYAHGKKTLDYGCGSGRSTRFLDSLGMSVVGVDTSKNMLDLANKIDPDRHYFLTESAKIPIADNSYDVVFSSFVFLVLESKDEIRKITKDVNRILKEDGIFIIITASENLVKKDKKWVSYEVDCKENMKSGDTYKVKNKEAKATFMNHHWTDEDYKKIFRASNFDLVETILPLGKENEASNWLSEKESSPRIIYVLRKK
jgi:ubiquinone/menaquinone biosynthesis C-methylase UbiE